MMFRTVEARWPAAAKSDASNFTWRGSIWESLRGLRTGRT